MFVRLHVRGLRLSVCLNTILMVEAQLQGVGWHEHLLGVVLGVREIFLSRESSKYVAFEQQFDPHSATRIVELKQRITVPLSIKWPPGHFMLYFPIGHILFYRVRHSTLAGSLLRAVPAPE